MDKHLQENIIVLIKKRLKEGWVLSISDKGIITIKPKHIGG